MNEYGRWYTPDETRKTVELTPQNWTLIEEKPVDIIKEIDRYFGNYKDPVTKEKYRKSLCWLNHRQAIKFARHFYELGQCKSEFTIAATEEELKKAMKERYPMPENADALTRYRIMAARNGFLSGYSWELSRKGGSK